MYSLLQSFAFATGIVGCELVVRRITGWEERAATRFVIFAGIAAAVLARMI